MFDSDCPGTQSESAGKSDACEGCPNQEACATAPKGPDPGFLPLSFFFSSSIKFLILFLFLFMLLWWLFYVLPVVRGVILIFICHIV